MNDLDHLIKKTLDQKWPKEEKMKEEIWNQLEHTLFEEKRKRRKGIVFLAAATAIFLLFISLQTNTGIAVMKNIKDFFVPEKETIQNIEGHDEKTNVHLHEGTHANYVIYLDETHYKMIKDEEADIITTIEPLPEQYPDVSMEIKQVADVSPEILVKQVEKNLKKDFPALREIETTTDPVEGFLLHGINGSERDSEVVHTYVISNGKNGSFIIKEKYFLEAAEGHGARFHHMLKSFEIVE